MKVEEDQVNLSDLGIGPDKPKIKRIYTKKNTISRDSEREPNPTPIKDKSKGKLSPTGSEENGEEESEENDEEQSSITEDVSDAESKEYTMKSELFSYADLSKSSKFKVKRYKDAIYRGEINPKTKLRHGTGIMEYDNGRVYEGQWENDLRCGNGYEVYANGNNYLGEFKEGKANGKGVYYWANGEFYDGEWSQGQKDGYGEWQSSDKETYIGYWKEGKASGQGWYTWK